MLLTSRADRTFSPLFRNNRSNKHEMSRSCSHVSTKIPSPPHLIFLGNVMDLLLPGAPGHVSFLEYVSQSATFRDKMLTCFPEL